MFGNFFKRPKMQIDHEFSTDEAQRRSAEGSSSAKLAVDLLRTAYALGALSEEEALTVVRHMRPKFYRAGTRVMTQGEERSHFMFLILEGEVTVESYVVSRVRPMTLTVLGAGEIIGEVGLIDDGPRSASCMVSADMRCGVLTRQALEELARTEPIVAGKFMSCIALRLAKRLRETSDKLKNCTQLVVAMQSEIDALMPTPPQNMQRSSNPPTSDSFKF